MTLVVALLGTLLVLGLSATTWQHARYRNARRERSVRLPRGL